MAILMLEGKDRFINTDHIVTTFIEGSETKGFTIVIQTLVGEHHLSRRFKEFEQAQQVLRDFAMTMANTATQMIALEDVKSQ